jgi:predicted transglutaminase-like cysteine proteinase
MKKITLLLMISAVFTAFMADAGCHSTVEKVPSVKAPPASFEVISLTFTLSGGAVTEIKARVRNSGGFGGVYNAKLSIDGDEIATRAIAVAPGSTETLNFDCSISRDDGYNIELDRFNVPIDQLFTLSFANPQVVTIGGDGISDTRQPQQIIHLPPLIPSGGDSKIITHSCVWLFGGVRWEWELGVEESLYNYFKGLQRPPAQDYSTCITESLDDEYLNNLVSELNSVARQNGYDALETIQFVAAFVQGLPYTTDRETTGCEDYVRYPVETLADLGGDCEDTAILLAALLDRIGQDVVLVAYPGHLGVGVPGDENTYGVYWDYNGREYFYLETSISGWKIGEIPEHLATSPAVIYPLN